MGKWTEELGKELVTLIKGLSKEKQEKKENMESTKKKTLTIRDIGLPRLMLMLLAGLVLLILTFPDIFTKTNSNKDSISQTTLKNTYTSTQKAQNKQESNTNDTDAYIENAEIRLKELLKKVEGVGDVEVMITIKATSESVPLKDIPYEKSSSSSEQGTDIKNIEQGERSEEGTVMIENSDGTQQPFIIKETVPEIEGVVVLAEGGGNSEIKKEIMEAVQALFNIKAHKIKVMKMN